MINGFFFSHSEHILHQCIIDSYSQVIGFIQWKIVIHAFIDGFSWLLLGICAHNNNQAQTVIVHNICIECLWVDITHGTGKKWKNLLCHLKIHDRLDADNNAHIWLLHYLFLNAINTDLEVWAEVWNYLVLAHQNEHYCSSSDMFAFGMQKNGLQELHLNETIDENLEGFGINWNDIDNTQIRNHYDAHNANDGNAANPFLYPPPDHLSHTEVLDPQCPFTTEQLALFEPCIAELPIFNMQDMQSQQLFWIDSLSITTDILSIQ
ncbi:hypothetical protein J132_07756 [Termitomyces sp. J132]|nr:hypothetical protein J132_07756 [Termitomyces sp. J132]